MRSLLRREGQVEREGVLIPASEVSFLLPLLLYAETHYRFRYWFSFLKKNEPELLADAPHRIEPATPLPLLILAKDADRYPSILREIRVDVRSAGQTVLAKRLLGDSVQLTEPLWWKIFTLDVSTCHGWIDLDVTLVIESNGSIRTYHNDNYRTASHAPLRVYVATEPLPRFPHLHVGDAHTHSNYTADQVEFGSPLEAARVLCEAMGLSFFCVTDHSYDLDDRLDSYLINDPELPKWKSLNREIDTLNEHQSNVSIVRGEEVTCRSEHGRNVHLLLLGGRRFFSGSGDGAEQWLRTRSEHSVQEILQRKDPGVLAFAAHPREPVPFLQRMLLGRGNWSGKDLHDDNLDGIQFLNGKIDEGYRDGYEKWIAQLLRGRRIVALAGNDAHGNFSRFRQLSIPFVSLRESDNQVFGRMRTGVKVDMPLSEKAILEGISLGRAILTDGPVIDAVVQNAYGGKCTFGGTSHGATHHLSVRVLSSEEFGYIQSLRVLIGEIGSNLEKTLLEHNYGQGFDRSESVTLSPTRPSYVRFEAFTSRENTFDNRQHFCLTNPIWIDL